MSLSLSHHNDRYRVGTMRDPVGYEAPYVVGAHLTHPTTPLGCLSHSLLHDGTISRKGAKPRCRSGLPTLICSSTIAASSRRFCIRDPRNCCGPRGQHATRGLPRLEDHQFGQLFSWG